MRWTAVRIIHAPADRVFHTVAEPEEFHRAIPDGENAQSRDPPVAASARNPVRMDPVTDRLSARVMIRLITRMVQPALDKDLDAVKVYCER